MDTHGNSEIEEAQAEIKAHITDLFDAFLAKDRGAIRRGHTRDWTGFQIPSKQMIRGIDHYMNAAETLLNSLKAVRYEFLEMEVEIHGDIGLAYYIARDWIQESGGESTVLIRALDVYRRDDGVWNQSGSNICVIADD